MTQDTQGVAQRVREQIRDVDRTADERICMLDGADIMHRELSAEARQVLLENEDALEQARSSKDAAEHRRLVTRRLTLVSTFQHLGLDLNEPEDSDD